MCMHVSIQVCMVCICVCRNAYTTAHMEVRGQTEVLAYLSSLFVARGFSVLFIVGSIHQGRGL